jgi:hypothetical protein
MDEVEGKVEAWPLPEGRELPPITERGIQGQLMDAAWPHYGGDMQTAEFWCDFGEGIRFAAHFLAPATLQSAIAEKDAEIARLQAERDGDAEVLSKAADIVERLPWHNAETIAYRLRAAGRAALALSKKDDGNG